MKRILIISASVFMLDCLLLAGLVGWNIWQRNHAPVFTLTQQPEINGNLTDSFLTFGEVRYVQTRAEYSLEQGSNFVGNRLIGRTDDGLEIRAIPGNDEYVSLSGFMFPALIFRKDKTPAAEPANLQVNEIRFFGNQDGNSVRDTSDEAQLINEVLHSLQDEPEPLPEFEQIFNVQMTSPDLPGLVYAFYAEIASSGKVYLAPVYDDLNGVPAGRIFSEWIVR